MKRSTIIFIIMFCGILANDCFSQSLERIWAKGRTFEYSAATQMLAFSNDGKYLFEGKLDHSLKVWNTITGEFEYKVGYVWDINAIECSPDNEKIAYGGGDGTLNVYNFKEDIFEYRINLDEYDMTRTIEKIKFSGTGQYLAYKAIFTTSPLLKIFKLKDSTYYYPKPPDEKSKYNNVRFSNDDKLYACDQIEYIKYPLKSVKIDICSMSDNSIVKQLTFQTIGNLDFNFKKEFLYVLINDTIHYYNLTNFKLEETFPFRYKEETYPKRYKAFSISSDANFAIVLDTMNFISIWNLKEKRKLYSIEILKKGAIAINLTISANNKYFAVSGTNGTPDLINSGTLIECYDLLTGKILWGSSKDEFTYTSCVSISNNKKWILTSNFYGNWNLINNETGEVFNHQNGVRVNGNEWGYRQLSDFSSNNTNFAVYYGSSIEQVYKILLYNVNDLNNPINFDIGNKEISILKISPDGKSIIVFFIDSIYPYSQVYKVVLYDIDSNLPIWQSLISYSRPKRIEFSRDGSRIAIGTDTKESLILDASTGSQIKKISNGSHVEDLYLNNNGTILVTSNTEGIINSYDVDKNILISHIVDNGVNVYSVSLSKDNNTIISGGMDGKIKFWDLYTGNLKYATRRQLSGQFISDFEISQDEKNIVVGDKTNDVLIYFALDLNAEVSVNDNNLEHFSISPNPATDFINIQPPKGLETSDVYKIQIFDMLGIEVSSAGGGVNEVDGGGSIRIDISNLPVGVYFIRIGDKVEKFVKM